MFNESDWNMVFAVLGGACALGGGAVVGLLWWVFG